MTRLLTHRRLTKDNFLKACDEYNSFGSALSNSKIRVEQNLALKLYGLKVHGNQTMLIFFSNQYVSNESNPKQMKLLYDPHHDIYRFVTWSPNFSGILYLRYLQAFYLAYLLAFYLFLSSGIPSWHSIWHIFLAFYLAYLLAYLLTSYLAFYLAYVLEYLLAFYLAYLLAFYLAFYLAGIPPGILSGKFSAYVLAYLLHSICSIWHIFWHIF